jgi:hypothetical protein
MHKILNRIFCKLADGKEKNEKSIKFTNEKKTHTPNEYPVKQESSLGLVNDRCKKCIIPTTLRRRSETEIREKT